MIEPNFENFRFFDKSDYFGFKFYFIFASINVYFYSAFELL